jgi:hypothetical protein
MEKILEELFLDKGINRNYRKPYVDSICDLLKALRKKNFLEPN